MATVDVSRDGGRGGRGGGPPSRHALLLLLPGHSSSSSRGRGRRCRGSGRKRRAHVDGVAAQRRTRKAGGARGRASEKWAGGKTTLVLKSNGPAHRPLLLESFLTFCLSRVVCCAQRDCPDAGTRAGAVPCAYVCISGQTGVAGCRPAALEPQRKGDGVTTRCAAPRAGPPAELAALISHRETCQGDRGGARDAKPFKVANLGPTTGGVGKSRR